jgi:ATP-binding cassette subfamily B protein
MVELWAAPVVPDEADAPVALDGSLEIAHLTFGYDEGSPALHDVSLRLAPGETVALAGRTGSGKSTLLALLPRLEEPAPGTIFLGGKDVTALPHPTVRRLVAVVPQETILFSDTLANNIAFGKPDASRDEIERAALDAGLGPDLERFPKGLDTMVGERGITLSGGQTQRTALARALLSEAPLLVLDDAFSSVDTETEARILDSLVGAKGTRTVLLVSHRLSTLQHADRIVFLEHGRVVESGTHAELLAKGGAYASFAERQRLTEEVEAA